MSEFLVTGAPGWLGNTLLRRLLKSGRTVRLIIDPAFKNADLKSLLPPFEAGQVEFHICDLRDQKSLQDAMTGITSVFHLAAVQHPANVSDFYAVNSDAAAQLARTAAAAGAKKFVFVSSCSVHGSSQQATNENTPLQGYTHYTQSKIKAEELLQQVRQETGLELAIIRPGVFYGVLPSVNMKKLMKMVQSKMLPVFGHDGFRRTYVDVEKVAEALMLAEQDGVSGTAYAIGDLEPLTTRELYETLATALGCRAKILTLPLFVSRTAEAGAFTLGKIAGMHVPMANIMGEFGRPTFFTSVNAASIGFEPHASSRPGLEAMAKNYIKSS
jgi:nucleoside-diphosphate-sugar epimerase